MLLSDLPPDARPREKLRALGPGSLANAEPLALLLRMGLAGKSLRHLAQELLDRFGGLAQGVFAVVFLDARLRLLQLQRVFNGSPTRATVYPREVARRALELGASAVILAHPPPSGVAEPSLADRHLTERLHAALALIDVRVVDHLVVGTGEPYSFAESGLL